MSTKNFTDINHLTSPVSSQNTSHGSKEAEPLGKPSEPLVVHEVVEHEVQDHQVKHHVQVRQEVPVIPPDLKKIGVRTSATPKFSTYNAKKLPLDPQKLPQAMKAPLSDSIRWLAALTQYLIEQTTSRKKDRTTIKEEVKEFTRLIGKDFGR